MPIILGYDRLKEAVGENGFIKSGNIQNIDGIKYDFCLSSKILKAKYKQPVDVSDFPETLKSELVIDPGEVVFVLTSESVSLPDNIMAILIPKRKLSHDGIMILGGLSIDPLYDGRLLIGLYNLSSTQYPIRPGRKLIGAHFFELNDEERLNVTKPQIKIDDFPDDLIRLMQNYKPISAETLLNDFSNLENRFELLYQEVKSKDDWFVKIKESMDKHEQNIDKILEGLKREGEDRRASDQAIDGKVEGFRAEIKDYMKSAYKTAGIVGVVGALVISLIFFILQQFYDFSLTKVKDIPKSEQSSVPKGSENNGDSTGK